MSLNPVAFNNTTLPKSVRAVGDYFTFTQGNEVSDLEILKVLEIHV